MLVLFIFIGLLVKTQSISDKFVPQTVEKGFDGSLSPISCAYADHSFWIPGNRIYDNDGKIFPITLKHFCERNFKNDLTIIMYGSSHIRMLMFSLVKFLTNKELPKWMFRMDKGGASGKDCPSLKRAGLQPICGHTGWQTHQINVCKEQIKFNIFYKFKTFTHTPEEDELFLTLVKNHSIFKRPDLIILEGSGSLWGPRVRSYTEKQVPGMSFDTQRDYFYKMMKKQFPGVRKIWMTGHAERCRKERSLIKTEANKHSFFQVLKDWRDIESYHDNGCTFERCRLAVLMPEEVEFAHGAYGVLLDVYSQMILVNSFN